MVTSLRELAKGCDVAVDSSKAMSIIITCTKNYKGPVNPSDDVYAELTDPKASGYEYGYVAFATTTPITYIELVGEELPTEAEHWDAGIGSFQPQHMTEDHSYAKYEQAKTSITHGEWRVSEKHGTKSVTDKQAPVGVLYNSLSRTTTIFTSRNGRMQCTGGRHSDIPSTIKVEVKTFATRGPAKFSVRVTVKPPPLSYGALPESSLQ